jgi:hypothetical protein
MGPDRFALMGDDVPLRQWDRERLEKLVVSATAKFTRRWGDPPASDRVQSALEKMLDEEPSFIERGIPPARRLGQIAKTLQKNSLRRKDGEDGSTDEDGFDAADGSMNAEDRLILSQHCKDIFSATRDHLSKNPMALRVFDKMVETGLTDPQDLVPLLGIERERVYEALRKIKNFANQWTKEQKSPVKGGRDAEADA